MSTTPNPIPDPAARHLQDSDVPVSAVFALEPEDLDGYTVDDLSDYLDGGMTPRDPVIDISPACQIALAALARLKTLTATFLDEEAAFEEPRDESWISSLLQNISIESRAGRQIPFRKAELRTELVITEGAVRGLIRAAGDMVHGILVGRSALVGDVTRLDEPITVEVEATIIWRNNIPDAAKQLREAIQDTLARNTDLAVAGITVTISDVHITPQESS
ncbi:Asp23/Gls24 family envelope stress response protein [Frondihabitans sp. VKM Ac-2883]|uniref:Asp23/Gls24 family envelope stress response protein n=1 Tax=Frondihabitans sp. VKM Ac-2883 TaxID=2783823 RepID=UPI00188B0564|nr:Asp23/Gls24 family envelope stress response protein [Frondihabitans sp. VKM Ac-2883]MBF4577586.1 Asp23/Gls24 family envelope stress response protein [Frondihabitans sp. VKM Ac-2883]